MNTRDNWQTAIILLRKSKHAKEQAAHLQYCMSLPIRTTAVLKRYHDALLFVYAYPFSGAVHKLALAELQRLASLIKQHQHHKQWKNALAGSGLPFTDIHCQFSAAILAWMLDKFPGRVKAAAPDDAGDEWKAVLQAALPQVEFYAAGSGKLNLPKRLKEINNLPYDAGTLHWLIGLFRQQQWNGVLQDHLFDSLKISVQWHLQDDRYCRSFLRWPVKKIFFRKDLNGKRNAGHVINQSPVPEIRLSAEEKKELVSVIRASLAFYLRETDPVSYADTNQARLFDMGKGIMIALTGMWPERQLAVESYIGFMAFCNGVPVSYGGGWIFGYRCKIGINIYPPFRGGDSEKLFNEVMRLYHRCYGVKRFVVAPYQFGKGNTEGLKSGAYWFYYRLGFRSADRLIAARAEKEWQKIAGDKKHRSPLLLLKQFTSCTLEWEPFKDKTIFIDADELSKAVTAMINNKFGGNREMAITVCTKHLKRFCGPVTWPVNETAMRVWENWSLIFYCLPGTEEWTGAEKRRFVELLLLKATGKEKAFTVGLQRHKPFWKAAAELLS